MPRQARDHGFSLAPEDIEFVTVPEYLAHKRIGGWEE